MDDLANPPDKIAAGKDRVDKLGKPFDDKSWFAAAEAKAAT